MQNGKITISHMYVFIILVDEKGLYDKCKKGQFRTKILLKKVILFVLFPSQWKPLTCIQKHIEWLRKEQSRCLIKQ